jgi:hypothetical protein
LAHTALVLLFACLASPCRLADNKSLLVGAGIALVAIVAVAGSHSNTAGSEDGATAAAAPAAPAGELCSGGAQHSLCCCLLP